MLCLCEPQEDETFNSPHQLGEIHPPAWIHKNRCKNFGVEHTHCNFTSFSTFKDALNVVFGNKTVAEYDLNLVTMLGAVRHLV